MTMNTNACRNVHNYVTYIKYINRAIMICLCAQRLVNTDHKTHNKIASNSIDFGLKMHYFQNFPGRCPPPRWGAHSAPQTPSWIFHPQTPLNPDPSTLLHACMCAPINTNRDVTILEEFCSPTRFYCNFTNFRHVKISVASDRGGFGVV